MDVFFFGADRRVFFFGTDRRGICPVLLFFFADAMGEAMALLATTALAWTHSAHEWQRSSTYALAPTFCRGVLGHVWTDAFLSWDPPDCRSVRTGVRRAFDAWEYNSALLTFREVSDATTADVVVRDDVTDGEVGSATFSLSETTAIGIARDVCWYTDASFCHAVKRNIVALNVVVGLIVGVALALFAILCCFSPPGTTSVLLHVTVTTCAVTLPLV